MSDAAQSEYLDPQAQRIKHLEHELEMLTNAGVIECAVRNKSVAEYMKHWEGRALTAEAQVAELRKELEELKRGPSYSAMRLDMS